MGNLERSDPFGPCGKETDAPTVSSPSVATVTPTSPPMKAPIIIDWTIKQYDDMTAQVGDVVEFNWSFAHNVYIYPALNGCDSTGKIEVGLVSGATYEFTEADAGSEMLFACDVGFHCQFGQIVKFTVSA